MYEIFGKYGAVYQIRLGDRKDTRGASYCIFKKNHHIAERDNHPQDPFFAVFYIEQELPLLSM